MTFSDPNPPVALPPGGDSALTGSGRYEQSVQRLEAIVAELEKPGLDLENSVRLFEEGMALVAECRALLDAAEGKVEMLVRRAEGMVPVPFSLKDPSAK